MPQSQINDFGSQDDKSQKDNTMTEITQVSTPPDEYDTDNIQRAQKEREQEEKQSVTDLDEKDIHTNVDKDDNSYREETEKISSPQITQDIPASVDDDEFGHLQQNQVTKSLIANVNLVDIQDKLTQKTKDRAQFYIGESDDEIIVNTKYDEDINAPSTRKDLSEIHVDKSETENSEKLYEVNMDFQLQNECNNLTIKGDTEKIPSKSESDNYLHGESDDTRSESDVTPDSDPNNKIPNSTIDDFKQDPDSSYTNIEKSYSKNNLSEMLTEEFSDQIFTEDSKKVKTDISEVNLQEPEARSIALELVDFIKNEVDNREFISDSDTETKPQETTQVSSYLKELAIEKGLDSRELQLIESVLARKNKDLGKIVRNDTQTSSMEITDEDLRSSGVETDYSPTESQVLLNNQQMQYTTEIADITTVEKTLAEVKESLEAAQDVLIEVSKDGGFVKKQSPSEFEFKVLTQGKIFEDVIEESQDDNQMQLEKELYSPKKVRVQDVVSHEKLTSKSFSKQTILKSNIKHSLENAQSNFKGERDNNLINYENEINEIQLGKILETDLQNMLAKDKIRKEKLSHTEQNVETVVSQDNQVPSAKIDDDQSQTSEVILRKNTAIKEKLSLTPKSDKRSGAETETCSSSGESHYNSFEQTDSLRSRPCSSDIDGIMAATGSSEYESALTSQEVSSRPLGSSEYHTAINSLSSRESMKSLDSESSGNVASLEASEASETLVPGAQDLEMDICEDTDKSLSEYQTNFLLDDQIKFESFQEPNESYDNITKQISLQSNADELEISSHESEYNIPHGMKRSQEMTFQPEPKPIKTDSPQSEIAGEIEDKYASSLDEGTALSMSLSSLSETSGMRTVIDMYESDLDRTSLSSSIPGETNLSDQQEKIFSMPSWQNLTAISTDSKVAEISIGKDTQSTAYIQARDSASSKVKGHRRNDSLSSFHPSKIPIKRNKIDISKTSTDEVIIKHDDTNIDMVSELAKSQESTDIVEDGTCQAHIGFVTADRILQEEAEAEAAFHMVPHMSPTHQTKIIDTILEDEDAEKVELEVSAKQNIEKIHPIGANTGAIPDITVTEHMTPLANRIFQYPNTLNETTQIQKSTPETPLSYSSKSSEETDRGQEYIVDDSFNNTDVSHQTKTLKKRISPTDSPTSDSFEMIEKPDITDDFVVIEEVAKEAQEFDSEGKSLTIKQTKIIKKHDTELEEFIVKSAPELSSTKILKTNDYDLGPFDFEDSPPNVDKKHVEPYDLQSEYDKNADLDKKWVETQLKGDANAGSSYRYEIEYEHGPLEDIKEEEIHDLDQTASRIGSMGSQKESVGSLSKESYSSTPEYDVLAGKKFFTRSADHDDISMNSLQEFENLEQAISLENKKIHHGSQDSLSNGSFTRRYYLSRSGQGDDISLSSLKEFEGLESACIEAHKIETKAKEEEAQLLSQIPEGSESRLDEQMCAVKFKSDYSEKEEHKKHIFEIDEIIRQAQDNVQKFIDKNEKSEDNVQGEKITKHYEWCDVVDPMKTSTDSLELKQSGIMSDSILRTSTDSLDIRSSIGDNMTASTDSIDSQMQTANKITESDTNEDKTIIGNISESLQKNTIELADSLDEDGSRLEGNISIDRHDSYSSGKDADSSLIGQDDHLSDIQSSDIMRDNMLDSTDSLEPTSSTATHATYQYETDSVMSGSFTSGGSNTMVSSVDHFDQINDDLNIRKVWFQDTTEVPYGDIIAPSKPYVSEVIEPSNEEGFYKIIHRTVGLPPEIRKVTFSGPNAEKEMQNYVSNFNEGEEMHEFQEVDEHGNVHIKRVIQKRMILQPDETYKPTDFDISQFDIHQSSSFVENVRDSTSRHYRDDTDHGFLNPEEDQANPEPSAASLPNAKGRLTKITQP